MPVLLRSEVASRLLFANHGRNMAFPKQMTDSSPTKPSLRLLLHSNGGVDKYPAKSHVRRVTEKLKASEGLIVIQGSTTQLYSNSDNPIPFRQDRYFYYLTGCQEADCYATYNIAQDRLILWLPPIDVRRIVWTGRGSTVEEALEQYDVDEAYYIQYSESENQLQTGLLSKFPLNVSNYLTGSQTASVPVPSWCYMQKSCVFQIPSSTESPLGLSNAIDACRVIKDEHEIGLIRQANDVTAKAHMAVLKGLRRMSNEAEVEAAYRSVCIASHAKKQAYAPIVGSGSNASELHYTRNEADFGNAQGMVIDAGCEVGCYASDVTRTVPINVERPGEWASVEAEAIYKLVEKMQEECIKRIRPGVRFIDLDGLARSIAIDGLLELDIFRGKHEDIAKAGALFAFFYHGLGHHLGLEVHDVSPLPINAAFEQTSDSRPYFAALDASLHNESASGLESGMVVTIEPGLYFNEFLLQNSFLSNAKLAKYFDAEVLKRYMPVGGVRIEDDILVTKRGYENLTTTPKGREACKIIKESV